MKKLLFKYPIASYTALFCMLFFTTLGFGQTKPEIGLHENTPNVIAFTHAKIVVAPGQIIEDGTLLIRDGYVEKVGEQIDLPPDAVTRDMSGKTIYPGFIDLFTDYGIQKATRKEDSSSSQQTKSKKGAGTEHWNPAVHPEHSSSEMLTHDKKVAKGLRKLGFTTVLSFPSNGIFRGNGALVLLQNKDPNQIILFTNVAQATSFSPGDRNFRQYPSSLMGSIALIRQTFYDTKWYHEAWTKFRRAPAGQNAPETNPALEALYPYMTAKKPVVMKVTDELNLLRADKIAEEFGLKMWILGSGYEYRRLQAVKNTGLNVIVPLDFTKKPDVSSHEKELHVDLSEMRHWDMAPENPGRLAKAGVDIALSTATMKKKSDFLKKLRTAVKRGLSKEDALKALTITPATWLNMSQLLGSLEEGKLANLVVTDGCLFKDKTKIIDTWVAGERYKVTELPETDVRGTWDVSFTTQTETDTGAMMVSGKLLKPKAVLRIENKKIKVKKLNLENHLFMLSFPGDSLGYEGTARMTGMITDHTVSGHGTWGDGSKFSWRAKLTKHYQEKPDTTKTKEDVKMAEYPVVYPEGGYGRTAPPTQPDALVVKNATIWTCGPDGIIKDGDLLVKKGKIVKVGSDLDAPSGAVTIDATGKHVTPGIIDAHSHLAISGGVNEGTHAITSEVRIEDVVDSDDINIYRQLAGGVTAACILHGSANPIGGTYAVIKLRWGALPDEMLLTGAKPGIKFALGENVKQSNWSNVTNPRYPQTRMGVMEIIQDAFRAAKDYRREWEIYEERSKKNKHLIPPRKNLRLEHLLEILDKERIIHCHSYRQDEILALIRLAEKIGFKVDVLIHVLEGYKVAEKLEEHGAMATVFSDWWAYKVEAFDAIPFNGALLYRQGVVVSYNSDSAELARRLNTEASKAVKYGNVPPEEALKFVTLNAAKQLFVDDQIGSLEKGKNADFVIWSDHPLSTYSACEQTWIDGRKYFDIEKDKELREKIDQQRNGLVQKILAAKEEKPKNKEKKKKSKDE